jgi:hypothetical protein
MPPPQPAEQQNSQPSAAHNPRHTRQVNVRHSAAGVVNARSTATSSTTFSKRGHSVAARQPLAATQAQLVRSSNDAETPQQRAADLKPQPPAAARSHANKPRPAKGSSSVSGIIRSSGAS